MSWLTEIAGKAENFLNAVDKGTATALTNVNSIKNVRKHSTTSTTTIPNDNQSLLDTEYIDTPDIMSLRTSTSTNSLVSDNGGNNHHNQHHHYHRKNDGNGHTRQSSYDSNGSKSHDNDINNGCSDNRLMEYLNNKDINNIPEEEWQSFTNNDQDNMKTTREIKELDLLNRKILELNTEYKKQKLKAQNYYNQMISNEKLIKDLNSKEQDLQESINVKDSQIAALKVQMEQLLLELQEKDEKYKELQLLNEKINNELHERLDNNEMINNLHNEIDQLKQSLEFEKIESKRIQDSCNQQIIRLENNQRSLIDELDSYRRQLNEQKSNRLELEILNNNLRKKYENIEQEFEQFKISKNKDNDLDNRTETSITTIETNIDTGDDNSDERMKILQEQCTTLMNELIEMRNRYDSIRTILNDYENETIPRQLSEIQTLNNRLNEEIKLKSKLQNEIDQLSSDCKSYQDDLNQIKSTLSARINERDEEIDKLRRQLILKQQHRLIQMDNNVDNVDGNSESSIINNEWEQRLKSLTENLISKQSLIEQLSSANHSLKLQLERSEQKFKEFMIGNSNNSNNQQNNNDVAIGIYHSPAFTNMIKHRMTGSNINNMDDIQSLIYDNPNDGQVTRKVKRAYTAIDKFSIRLGNFLRQYPSARAAFLCYIILLHIWVAFVLMYYEPEIHSGGSDFHSKMK